MSESPVLTEKWEGTWWTPIWEFFIHVSVGTILFVVIAVPAIGLSLSVFWLEQRGVSRAILWGLTGCEYLLFGVDLLLFFLFVLRQGWKALVRLW